MDDDDANMAQREAEKVKAITAIAEALTLIEYRDGIPDPWERACIGHALAAVFSGFYDLAAGEARLATLAPNKRGRMAQSTLTVLSMFVTLHSSQMLWSLLSLSPLSVIPISVRSN